MIVASKELGGRDRPGGENDRPAGAGYLRCGNRGLDSMRNSVPIPPGAPAPRPAPGARWNRGAWLFRDQTLQALEYVLDEAFRVPGTRIRLGIDGIIGLAPGVGDALAGLLSLIFPLAAWVRGVPYVTIARMAVNLAAGVLVGSVPLFGDIFLIAWKANRRNYRLLQRHLAEPRRHTWRDWLFLLVLLGSLALVFAIPLAVAVWLLWWVLHG